MIVDFRIRPPFRSFRDVFKRQDWGSVSDDLLMETFLAELDQAGIEFGVAMGRTLPAESPLWPGSVTNEDVAALVTSYPGRFAGFGSVDVRDVDRALDEARKIAELGLSGIAFDNPLSLPHLYDDDESLFPIYEFMEKNGLIAALTSSVVIGPDVSYSNPRHIQRVAAAFPQLRIVIPHGCWPWTEQALAILLRAKYGAANIWLMPDVYLNMKRAPAQSQYLDATEWGNVGDYFASRILFASSYPAQSPLEAVAEFKKIGFSSAATQKILSENATSLLSLK